MTWQIAQINIARAIAPLDDPQMADFVAQIADLNALAEQSPGFVWRWDDAPPEGTDPRLLLNVGVWASVEALADFTYHGAHRAALARRRRWFAPPDGPHLALWWVEAGCRPGPEEGFRRLAVLAAEGPSPAAFTFACRFDPPS